MRFAEFDKDHDQRLDFKEFCAFQPAKIRAKVSENELRKWFDAADTDGNGTLTLNEFFTWSLGTSARRHGAQALEAAFSAYDKDGTGRLDAVEFTLAAEEMGFGNAAHQIFEQLDADGSGSITYAELVASLTEPPDDGATTSMLTAMVWAQELSSYNDSEALDTSTWIIRGRDVDSVRSELRHLMTESGATVADLLKHFDMDNEQRAAKASIDMMEFRTAMVKVRISRSCRPHAAFSHLHAFTRLHTPSHAFTRLLTPSHAFTRNRLTPSHAFSRLHTTSHAFSRRLLTQPSHAFSRRPHAFS